MNTFVETKQYYLQSNAGTKLNGDYNSKIKFNIPFLIQFNKKILYQTAKLSHCEIPYSFYIINETNNKIKINNIDIEIDLGNYNAYTLLDKINDLLADNGINATMTLNTNNGKYILSSSSPIAINSSTIYKVLGLENSSYTGIFDITTSKYFINFPYPANTGGIRNIYIKTNLLTNNLNLQNNDAQMLKSVPVNVPPFGIIMYNNNENIETLVKNRETDYLEVELKDDDGNLINFNNQDWTICIEIKATKQYIFSNFDLNDFFEKVQ
jgi:hypothetical protein